MPRNSVTSCLLEKSVFYGDISVSTSTSFITSRQAVKTNIISKKNHISGVIVSIIMSRVVDHRLLPLSGQTKDYEIGICCFSAKHAALRRKSKDWLPQNQDNVSEWSSMSTCGSLFP